MVHRIREAMRREPMAGLLKGEVVVDETYIGGKPSNRHGHKLRTRLQGVTDKTPVVALISRDTGEIRAKAVTNVTAENLHATISGEVEPKLTILHTDGNFRYPRIARYYAGHEVVDHQAGEYVRRDGVSTNKAENFFSQLKRSLDGTHHHVSAQRLNRYVDKFAFRHTYCDDTDTERMVRIIGRTTGRRMTYKRPTDR